MRDPFPLLDTSPWWTIDMVQIPLICFLFLGLILLFMGCVAIPAFSIGACFPSGRRQLTTQWARLRTLARHARTWDAFIMNIPFLGALYLWILCTPLVTIIAAAWYKGHDHAVMNLFYTVLWGMGLGWYVMFQAVFDASSLGFDPSQLDAQDYLMTTVALVVLFCAGVTFIVCILAGVSLPLLVGSRHTKRFAAILTLFSLMQPILFGVTYRAAMAVDPRSFAMGPHASSQYVLAFALPCSVFACIAAAWAWIGGERRRAALANIVIASIILSLLAADLH